MDGKMASRIYPGTQGLSPTGRGGAIRPEWRRIGG